MSHPSLHGPSVSAKAGVGQNDDLFVLTQHGMHQKPCKLTTKVAFFVLHCFDEKIICDSNIIKCILDAYIFHETSNVNKTLIASHCRTMFILNLYSVHYSLKPATVVPVNASSARALPRR